MTPISINWGAYKTAIIFGLITLILSLLHTHLTVGWSAQPIHQMDIYPSYALNMLDGYGYGDCVVDETLHCLDEGAERVTLRAYRLPGYPIYIAALLVIFGTKNVIAPVLISQSVLSGAIVMLTVNIAQGYGKRVGVLAGVLMVTNYGLYFLTSQVMTEILFTWLMLILALALVHARGSWHYATAGVILGALLLTRGTLIFTLPLLYLVIRNLRAYSVMLIAALVIVLPWSIRNYRVFHMFVPFSTGSGQVLYGSWHPITLATAPGLWLPPDELTDTLPVGELEQDRYLQQQGVRFVRELNLPALARATPLKVMTLFGLYEPAFLKGIPVSWLLVYLVAIVRFAVVGALWQAVRALWSMIWVRVCVVFIVGAIANSAAFWGGYRLLFPYTPYMVILTAIGIHALKNLRISANSCDTIN